MKKKSLGINALLNSLQSLLNLIFPIVTFPYISRTLSVSGVGKYNFSNSIVSYFLLIATLGISTFAVREGAKLRNDRHAFSEFASRIFTISLISMLVSYVLLFLTLALFSRLHEYITATLIFSLQIVLTTIGTDWVYIIFEEYGYITTRNIIFKFLSIILLFVFIRHSGDYLNYAAITVFASAGSYLLNFFHTKKFCDLKINFNFNWKSYLAPILTIFVSTIAVKIYGSSDTTMLGLMKNNYVVGIYSVSTKIYTMVGALWSAILAVTIPRLAMLMGTKQYKKYHEILDQLINLLIILVIPALVGLIMLSKEIVLLIAGQQYLRSTSSLAILSLALIFSALNGLFYQCVLIPAKREKYAMWSTFVAAIVNIGLNFVMIPLLSENGAAITTVLAEFTTMSLDLYYGWDILSSVFTSKQNIRNIVSVLISCFAIVVLCLIGKNFIENSILRIGFDVMSSVIVYTGLLLLLRNSVAKKFHYEFKERFSH